MSEELIYIVNGKKSNGNKRKNLLGKNERIGLREKGLKQGNSMYWAGTQVLVLGKKLIHMSKNIMIGYCGAKRRGKIIYLWRFVIVAGNVLVEGKTDRVSSKFQGGLGVWRLLVGLGD